MSRLASFATPPPRTRSSRTASPSPAPSPPPQRVNETTSHRMLRLVILESQNTFKTWHELILADGMKYGKGCVDARTEMENIMESPETSARPPVMPHLLALETNVSGLSTVISKLDRCLNKLRILTDQAEKLLFDALRTQPPSFSLVDPLWSTWTLEHFVNSLPGLIQSHSEALAIYKTLYDTLTKDTTDYEDGKTALEQWRDQGVRGEARKAVEEWEEVISNEMP